VLHNILEEWRSPIQSSLSIKNPMWTSLRLISGICGKISAFNLLSYAIKTYVNNLFWTFENFNVWVSSSPLPASVYVTSSGFVTVGCFCWLSVAFCQHHYHYSWMKFRLQPRSGDGGKIPITSCKGRIILHLPFSVPPPLCPELNHCIIFALIIR